MRLLLATVIVCLGITLATPGARASAISPPVPPTCAWCDGPPPPPLPVPTLAPTEVAPSSVISVKLSPTHLQRGRATTLRISASSGDDVTTAVQYRDTKTMTYKAQIGDSGSLTKVWKVPSYAGVGRAQLKVTVDDPDGPYTTTISFEVVK